MKNVWLVVLFVFFLAVLILSLLITRQSQRTILLSDKETGVNVSAEEGVVPANALVQTQVFKPAPAISKSGITIISAPGALSPEEKISRIPKAADKTGNNLTGTAVTLNNESAEPPQSGVTKTGKVPTLEKTQEMNSSGIVLY